MPSAISACSFSPVGLPASLRNPARIAISETASSRCAAGPAFPARPQIDRTIWLGSRPKRRRIVRSSVHRSLKDSGVPRAKNSLTVQPTQSFRSVPELGADHSRTSRTLGRMASHASSDGHTCPLGSVIGKGRAGFSSTVEWHRHSVSRVTRVSGLCAFTKSSS